MKTFLSRALAVAVALGIALPPASAVDFPVFRWKTAAGSLPGAGSDTEGEIPPTANPLDGPTTHLRVTVTGFSGSADGALAELAFTVGSLRLAPTSASVLDNAGVGDQNAFDGNESTSWTGAAGTKTAKFVYEIPAGANPDHLEIVASGGNAPSAFTIERSPNNLSYIPIVSYDGESAWTAGEKRVFPFTLAPKPSGTETAAHKYWRVAVEKWNPGAYAGTTEIVFRDRTGADVTVGGRGSVAGPYPTTVSRVFDKKFDPPYYTEWRNPVPVSFTYEFPLPQALASVDIGADGGLAGPAQRFRVESSDDGRQWTVEARYLGQGGWAANENRNFPIPERKAAPGEHQFWRTAILKTSMASGQGSLNDLDVIDDKGSSRIKRAVAIASSTESGTYDADYFQDNEDSNPWRSAAGDAAPWAGYAFPEPVKAEQLLVRASGNSSPRDLAVEWSDDGDTWVRTSSYAGHGNWSYAAARTFPVKQPPVPAGHHRFWRVFVDTVESPTATTVRLYEVTFLDVDGNALERRGVGGAGSEDSLNTGAKAFDGRNDSTYSWLSTKVPEWAAYEFPEAQKPVAVKIASQANNGPQDFRVQWSDDGNEWTTVSSHSGNGSWASAEERTFPFETPAAGPGEHQYWRLNMTATDGSASYIEMWELDFVAADGVDRQQKGNPIYSGQHSTYTAKRAFDNGATTEFRTAALSGVPLPQTIGYAFPRPVPVNEVRIVGSDGGNGVRDFDIQWSDDGKAWTTAETYTNAGNWANKELRVFPIPKPKEGFEEAYGYAINMRQIVPQGFAGTVNPMRLNNVKLVGGDGVAVATKGVPLVKWNPSDKTIANAFDASTTTYWLANAAEVRVDIGMALPMRVTDYQATVTTGCTGCEVEMILYRFVGDEATGRRDEVLKRVVR